MSVEIEPVTPTVYENQFPRPTLPDLLRKVRAGRWIHLPSHRRSRHRRYRGVQNDPEVLSKFRVIAFDMPWHGKLLAAAGIRGGSTSPFTVHGHDLGGRRRPRP